MTTAVFSDYAGNAALRAVFHASGLYLALHTSDPTSTGLLSSEVAGGGYARQPITFAYPSSKAVISSNRQRYAGMPACTVTYLAVWDSVSMGQMIAEMVLPSALAVPDSGMFIVAPGDLAFTLP